MVDTDLFSFCGKASGVEGPFQWYFTSGPTGWYSDWKISGKLAVSLVMVFNSWVLLITCNYLSELDLWTFIY